MVNSDDFDSVVDEIMSETSDELIKPFHYVRAKSIGCSLEAAEYIETQAGDATRIALEEMLSRPIERL